MKLNNFINLPYIIYTWYNKLLSRIIKHFLQFINNKYKNRQYENRLFLQIAKIKLEKVKIILSATTCL